MKKYAELTKTLENFSQSDAIKKRYSLKTCYIDYFKNEIKNDSEKGIEKIFMYGFLNGFKQTNNKYKEFCKNAIIIDLEDKNILDIKKKVLKLICDMPEWAQTDYEYIYNILVYGMTTISDLFNTSVGHEQEIFNATGLIPNGVLPISDIWKKTNKNAIIKRLEV